MSAVGTTGSFGFLFLSLAIGFSAGCGVIVAQFFGAGQEKDVRKTASTGILLLLGMGAMITFISIAVSKPAFTYWLAIPDELMDSSFENYLILYVDIGNVYSGVRCVPGSRQWRCGNFGGDLCFDNTSYLHLYIA